RRAGPAPLGGLALRLLEGLLGGAAAAGERVRRAGGADALVAGLALAEHPLAGGRRRPQVALRRLPAAGLGGARRRPAHRLPEPGGVRRGRPGVPGLSARLRDRPAPQAQVRALLG